MIGWLTKPPSVAYWFEESPPPASLGPENYLWTGWVLVAWSLVWAGASVLIWNLTAKLFGLAGGLWLLPSLAVAAVSLLGPARSGAELLCRLAGRNRPARIALIASLVSLAWLACLTALRHDYHFQQEPALPRWIAWIRPGSKIDRVLWLLPLWGGWSMLICPQLHRPDPSRQPALAGMVRGCGPMSTTVLMGLLLAGSIGYFAYLPWTQLVIWAAGLLGAIGGGLLLVHLAGGMRREVLLAGNLLTQWSVLVAFLAVRDWR